MTASVAKGADRCLSWGRLIAARIASIFFAPPGVGRREVGLQVMRETNAPEPPSARRRNVCRVRVVFAVDTSVAA